MFDGRPLPGGVTDLGGRRMLDTAEGVLIGLRRCTPDTAFREVINAARKHGVPVFSIAGALVELASCDQGTPTSLGPARVAAQREWGHLLMCDDDALPEGHRR